MVSKPGGTKNIPVKTMMMPFEKFFQRPFFLSFTIGIPFCVFKLLFGITLIRAGFTALWVAGCFLGIFRSPDEYWSICP